MENLDIAALALELFREIQLVIATATTGDRSVFRPGATRFETQSAYDGYGLEGGMTDERLRSLLDELYFPRSRRTTPDGRR